MGKVSYVALNNASVKITNDVDTERTYEIEAVVNINTAKTVVSIDNGFAKKNGGSVASFNTWGDNMFNIGFQTSDDSEQLALLAAIKAFISDVKTYVATEFILN